jgi:GT2 family glycosyltransferase
VDAARDAGGSSRGGESGVAVREAPLRFSVVVPTWRRPGQLRAALAALAALEYPTDKYEVIVVDDGGGIDRSLAAAAAPNVRFVEQPHTGPAAARNRGAAEASGEILVFTDDDCRPDSSWLKALADMMVDHRVAAVGGRVVNAVRGNIFGEATQMLIEFINQRFAAERPERSFATTNNLAVDRAAFLEVGGFDVSFPRAAGEDREFAERWQRLGRSIAFAPEAVVAHAQELSLVDFLRRHFGYGRGAYTLRARATGRNRQLESPAFYAMLVLAPLGRSDGRGRSLVLVLLLAVAQIATAAGYLFERFSRRTR